MNVAEKECCFIACFLRGFQAHGACFLRGSQAHGSGWTFRTGNEKRTQTSFVNGIDCLRDYASKPAARQMLSPGERGGLSQEQTPCNRKIHCKYGALLLSGKTHRQNISSFFYKRVISERRRFLAAPA
ncbi:hypothetical protein [uncultured Mailhella sp.]|uniref:hypothetical protein n=1 Tax=uncultured Mailhella sp. TaxID=1981031 RepID=UPI0032087053